MQLSASTSLREKSALEGIGPLGKSHVSWFCYDPWSFGFKLGSPGGSILFSVHKVLFLPGGVEKQRCPPEEPVADSKPIINEVLRYKTPAYCGVNTLESRFLPDG